jgi:hypothetical protein
MNRRFFITSAAVVPLLGCSRVARDRQKWFAEREQALANRHQVAVDSKRTTPPAPKEILKSHPELKGLTKVAHRMHPRYSREPDPTASKIGGSFLWPNSSPWPVESNSDQPLVPVLQLNIHDAPPQLAFREQSDYLQVFWAMSGELRPVIVWSDSREVDLPAKPPAVYGPRVPIPCRLFPERIAERPGLSLLPTVESDRLRNEPIYDSELSVAPGTKIGGYARHLTPESSPVCNRCRRGMDYLLTIDTEEWNVPRWRPIEESDDTHRHPLGINLGRGTAVDFFLCRRCDHWPIKHLLR